MVRLIRFSLLSAVIAMTVSSWATTYYISTSGSDANNGTSKTTPWQHAPGMSGCSANCLSKANSGIQAGDQVILRGGDRWHYLASKGIVGVPWNFMAPNGTQSNPVYVGVDHTWFNTSVTNGTVNTNGTTVTLVSGQQFSTAMVGWGISVNGTLFTVASVSSATTLTFSASAGTLSGVSFATWSRPVLDADNPLSTTAVASCTGMANGSILNDNGNWTTYDDIEFTGYCWNTQNAGFPSGVGFISQGWYNITYKNLYFHGWTHTASAASAATAIVAGTSGTVNHYYSIVVDGQDSDATSLCSLCFNNYDVQNSVFRYHANFVGNGGHRISNSLFENMREPFDPAHGNTMEWNNEAGGSGNYIFNNLIRNNTAAVNFWVCPGSGNNDYYFNNVMYGISGEGWAFDNSGSAVCPGGGTGNFVNNTFVSTSVGTNGAFRGNFDSNFFINSTIGGTPLATKNQVSTSTTNAAAYGFTSATAFAPTSSDCNGNPTSTGCPLGKGSNLTSTCSALNSIAPGVGSALCQDSTLGPNYDLTYHRVNGNARTPMNRPSTGAWDAGAFQLNGQVASVPPTAPNGLSAIVN